MIYKIKYLKRIIQNIYKKNFYLKIKKCEFHKQQVEYLKHIITTEKLKMNSEKIKVILKFSTFKCIKNIQAFQKLIKYYRKFIMNFVKITASLTNLLQKN